MQQVVRNVILYKSSRILEGVSLQFKILVLATFTLQPHSSAASIQ